MYHEAGTYTLMCVLHLWKVSMSVKKKRGYGNCTDLDLQTENEKKKLYTGLMFCICCKNHFNNFFHYVLAFNANTMLIKLALALS